jgi:hypothetical protein
MNWRAHVKHRLALGHHRMRTMARIMTANGIRRKLARKVGWAVAVSTAAYGIEAIWEGREVEISTPRVRLRTPWSKPRVRLQPERICHAWLVL